MSGSSVCRPGSLRHRFKDTIPPLSHVSSRCITLVACFPHPQTESDGSENRISRWSQMIYLARQEGATKEGAREKLRRRSSVRRKSTGDLSVQVTSHRFVAGQRVPAFHSDVVGYYIFPVLCNVGRCCSTCTVL